MSFGEDICSHFHTFCLHTAFIPTLTINIYPVSLLRVSSVGHSEKPTERLPFRAHVRTIQSSMSRQELSSVWIEVTFELVQSYICILNTLLEDASQMSVNTVGGPGFKSLTTKIVCLLMLWADYSSIVDSTCITIKTQGYKY